jgi:tetratricopeptide (TPR) repeat protein
VSLLRRALAHHQQGELDAAIDGYRQALAADEQPLAAAFNLGIALRQQNKLDDAEAALRRCLSIDPDFVRALDAIGLLLAESDRLFEAEAILQHSLATTPSLDTAANLGAIYQKQGRPDAAFGVLYPHLKAGAHHPVGWNTLGAALMDRGDLTSAAGCFERAFNFDPKNPAPLLNLHAAVFDDHNTDAARRCLEQACDVAPDDPAVRFHLGVIWGLLAPAAADAHHNHLPPEAAAWRESWSFYLKNRDPDTRLLGATAATLRFAADLARRPGLVVELGVRFGTTLQIIHEAVGQDVHGFDSFAGLPEPWHRVPAGTYSTNGQLPSLKPGAHLHAGLFADTLPTFLANHPGDARLIHIDCDLYSATAEALDALAPRVRPGTVIVFDEYLMNPFWQQDEHKALLDVGTRRNWRWRYAAFSLFSHQAVVEILAA